MTTLRLLAPVCLAAAAAGKPRRMSIVAYSGDVMTIGGFGPLVIDLAGLELPTSFPLLADHANALAAMVGTGRATSDGKVLMVDGTATDTAAGLDVIKLLEGGHGLQASVGCEPGESEFVPPGSKITVNGRTIEADGNGFKLIKSAVLREVSILPIGADGSTSVSLAARAAGVSAMGSFEEYVKGLGLDAAKLTPEAKDALEKAYAAAQADDAADKTETEKPAEAHALIGILAGTPTALQVRAAKERWSERRCNAEALTFLRAGRASGTAGNYGGSGGGSGSATDFGPIEAALLVRAGYEKLAEKHYGARTMEESRPLHRENLPALMAHAMRLSGFDPGPNRDFLRASGSSTASIATLLSNVANKILELTWIEAPATWRSFSTIKRAANFKTHTSLRPTFSGNLSEVGASGEVAHGSVGEWFIQWSVHQFAKQYNFDRKTIINDDLSGLSEAIPSFARAAARTLNDLVYYTVLSNAGSFFSNGNVNYQSGAGSALSAASLTTAIKQLRKQTNPEGGYLDLTPSVLVVPPVLEQTARELLHGKFVFRDQTADRQSTFNAFQGIAELQVEPRLENGVTNPLGKDLAAGSATGWYLFAAPQNLPMLVGFLLGAEAPTVQTFPMETNFEELALVVRAIHDFGTALGDYRAAQFSKGAA